MASVQGCIRLLDHAMDRHRRANRFQVGLAALVILIGAVTILLAWFQVGTLVPEGQKWLFTCGGSFISSLSSFPIRDLTARGDRIASLALLKSDGEELQAVPETDPRSKEFTERVLRIVEKYATG